MPKEKNLGGKKAKGLARKLTSGSGSYSEHIRLSTCDLEQYAVVLKLLGNGMCHVITTEGKTMLAHIRNKFRGRSKRNNEIKVMGIVLVGMREWENPYKNCDVMEVYDDRATQQLRALPNVDISSLDKHIIDTSSSSSKTNNSAPNLDFTNDVPEQSLPAGPMDAGESNDAGGSWLEDDILVDDI
jgi:translation initiation factor IF-1